MTAYWRTVLKATLFGWIVSPLIILILFMLMTLIQVALRPWTSVSFNPTLVSFLLGTALCGYGTGSQLAQQKRVQHGISAAVLTALIPLLLALFVFPQPSSDWRLIRRFERNEAVFNELRQAVQGEGEPEAIPASSSQTSEAYTAERLELSAQQLKAYQADMQRLRLLWVSEGSSDPNIVYFSVKDVSSNIEKHYLYSPTPPTRGKIVDRIRESDVEQYGRVYRAIGEGWYLYARPISN